VLRLPHHFLTHHERLTLYYFRIPSREEVTSYTVSYSYCGSTGEAGWGYETLKHFKLTYQIPYAVKLLCGKEDLADSDVALVNNFLDQHEGETSALVSASGYASRCTTREFRHMQEYNMLHALFTNADIPQCPNKEQIAIRLIHEFRLGDTQYFKEESNNREALLDKRYSYGGNPVALSAVLSQSSLPHREIFKYLLHNVDPKWVWGYYHTSEILTTPLRLFMAQGDSEMLEEMAKRFPEKNLTN
jgi:hypothetical protein